MLLSTAGVLLQLLASASPQDARLLRDARTAQVRFESVRRMHLPRDWHGGSGGACDARIGRYCYWYDSTETPPVPEPPRITEARDRLLSILDSSAARNPGDAWIAGQRTRYLIEAGRADEAAAVARACDAERWWCSALEGLALHVSDRYAAADSAFGIALEAMPEAQRCEWLDLHLLVTDRVSREISRAPCDQQGPIAQRLWTLGQPLWSTPGNDLRTEHFARLTMAAILARSANAHGLTWGDDSRELLIRYGWAEWFTRQEAGPSLYASPAITGHDREPSFYFFPDVKSARNGIRISPESWALRMPTARSRYAPRHLKGLSGLSHQLVRLPRGDSMLLATAFEIRDTALARDSVVARIVAYRHGELRVAEPRTGALWTALSLPNDSAIASIEVLGVTSKHAARARYTIDPLPRIQGAALSDLLLFDPSRGYSGADFGTLMSEALTADRISARAPLGVYWEIEGAARSAPAWISLTVEPIRVSLPRRMATRLHLAQPAAPVRLRWQSMIQKLLENQSVVLRLPPGARGRYRVVLTVEPYGGSPLTTSREIELVP